MNSILDAVTGKKQQGERGGAAMVVADGDWRVANGALKCAATNSKAKSKAKIEDQNRCVNRKVEGFARVSEMAVIG
jgi:hypothetical protein